MNNNCHGNIFEVNGERLYKCKYDGKIVEMEAGKVLHICPLCSREVEATRSIVDEVKFKTDAGPSASFKVEKYEPLWKGPHEWLNDKLHEWDRDTIVERFLELANRTSQERLDEIFCSEMESDGYYKQQLDPRN